MPVCTCSITPTLPFAPHSLQSDQTSSTVKRVFGNGTIVTVATVTSNPPAVGLFAGGPVNGGGLLINCRSRVLMLWANSTLSQVAGTGVGGLSGDGAAATLAQISGGWGAVAADPAGPGGGWVLADQVRVAMLLDERGRSLGWTSGPLGCFTHVVSHPAHPQGNHAVRRVTSAGIIVRVAGTGTASYSGARVTCRMVLSLPAPRPCSPPRLCVLQATGALRRLLV